jgi:hypothetical protein
MDPCTRRCTAVCRSRCRLPFTKAFHWFRSLAVSVHAALDTGRQYQAVYNYFVCVAGIMFTAISLVRALAVKYQFCMQRGGWHCRAVDNDLSLAIAGLKSSMAFLGSGHCIGIDAVCDGGVCQYQTVCRRSCKHDVYDRIKFAV